MNAASSDRIASPPAAPTRVLILGGSAEASALAAALAGRAEVAATLSLAGRTVAPAPARIGLRVGGFGGSDGLAAYLQRESVGVVVDATHPFATRISRNAREAAARTGCELVTMTRPAWQPQPGDRWTEVATMADAASALGPARRRVFLTIGRLQLAAFAAAPHHDYLVRTIESVEAGGQLARATFIEARGPFTEGSEEGLMKHHRIEVLVTKNSGGAATAPKLAAARRLGIAVILVRRPAGPAEPGSSVGEVLAAISAHRARAARGV